MTTMDPNVSIKTEDTQVLDVISEPDERQTITVLAASEGENSENVKYYVDDQGRYYYEAAETPAPDPTPEAIVPEVTEDNNSSLLNLLHSPNEYILVFQEVDDAEQEPAEQPTDSKDNIAVYDFTETMEAMDAADAGSDPDSDSERKPRTSAGRKRGYKKDSRKARSLFQCMLCPYTSKYRFLLSRHMKSHSEDRPYMCSVCERKFKTRISWQNHVNAHQGVKPFACKQCESAFTTSGELVRHIRYRHTRERPHRCPECSYAAVEMSKLKRHMRCHSGERPYQCPHCTYASQDTFKLKRHLRTHTGEKPYKCDKCGACFTQSNSLKSHQLRHTTSCKPVFACELCPATCARKTDLYIHVQNLHTAVKPTTCTRCGKLFLDRYSYKLHVKTHEGEKCFKCELCPYAAGTLRHLNSHMLTHTNEKPFVCDCCNQSFRQKQLLRRHINLYHNPDYVPTPSKEKTHECTLCKKQFAHKGNLIRHLAIHDPSATPPVRRVQRKVKVEETSGNISNVSNNSDDLKQVDLQQMDLQQLDPLSSADGTLVIVAESNGTEFEVLQLIR